MNSARYIDLILEYYSSFRIPTIVFVDSKTSDNTIAVAERFTRVIPIKNPGTTVEEVIQQISCSAGSEFVLRMDDDELPSIGMIEFAKTAVQSGSAAVYGFPRLQCAISIEGSLLEHLDHDAKNSHRQWRLYSPTKVGFTKGIHTPGIDLALSYCVPAPDDAYMIHLDWALHSYEQRKMKVARYDAHKLGAGSYFRYYYLYEDAPGANERFKLCDLPEFKLVARNIGKRFHELCIKRNDLHPVPNIPS